MLSLDVRRSPFATRWYLWTPVALVVIGVSVPLAYLVVRAFEAEADTLVSLVFRMRNLRLLGNTVGLAAAVLGATAALALPLAWLSARTDVWGRRAVTLLGVLPLAVPGYVMAYALLATAGPNGTLADLAGLVVPRPHGFVGAWLALSLSTFPYLFLNLRTALLGLDPALEESARSLGATRRAVVGRVVLPQLLPAFLAGGLLVVLHVLGDFGVVSLMRFETFSYAVYLQYAASYDRIYAAWLALMLLALTGSLLWGEARLLRGRRFDRAGSGAVRRRRRTRLGAWQFPAVGFAGSVGLLSVGVPVVTIVYWLGRGTERDTWGHLAAALADSATASALAAVLAATLAVPVAYLGVRQATRGTRILERVAYLGYATPPLAFALAFVFFSLRAVPWAYQTLGLLVFAYALHFLAEALGPVRSALYQAPPQVEEAARSLGRSPVGAFFAATFPLLRRGLVVSAAFVFLSALKELPITFLLSPLGFESLAMRLWSAASESLFSAAAPYALALVLASAVLVGLLLQREEE